MSFFEELAYALDADGIESRVNDDVMFVPITSELEIQFVEIDPHLPAANVYIAASNEDDGFEEDFEAVLVSVVFSAEDGVRAVQEHVATDQVVTVLRDLLEGSDERINDLEFFQDPVDANIVHAELADRSALKVHFQVFEGVPLAKVSFITFVEGIDEIIAQVIDDLLPDNDLDEEETAILIDEAVAEIREANEETLELGSFTDFDRLFDVLSLAADQAEEWEAQLAPLDEDEPEVYDIFVDDLEDGDFDEINLDEDEDNQE
ncbi:Uncharacterised protein [Corynebacterium kutscheri]|uniref:Uncharacterized protein n=1 Tax=Corynebacterium kutscheri TaxID=35755 RepID=A0A0F6TEB4_9CORY|nr:hypothetical protein [Corynebacterium kutscheri]AKE41686.1 hypothetical protein UL82_07625 [Corynebacterium kutscheri]VEH10013.1 Uncharacterised protein [Corynebacterium kutscheri]VEH80094.1 Uncharacterised protein [Corynebacterium kutscheri]